jgi:hypothetical protein
VFPPISNFANPPPSAFCKFVACRDAADPHKSPRNKILFHSFVESSDARNIYDGTAPLDKNGEVTIQLPNYFDALNKDVRYQFFAMDQAMPNLYIKVEEHDNHFTIGGSVPGGEISWQITGVRHDPYILARIRSYPRLTKDRDNSSTKANTSSPTTKNTPRLPMQPTSAGVPNRGRASEPVGEGRRLYVSLLVK